MRARSVLSLLAATWLVAAQAHSPAVASVPDTPFGATAAETPAPPLAHIDPVSVCPADGSIRLRVRFTTVANQAGGDALPRVDLGDGTTAPAGEAILLRAADGTPATDPALPAGRGLSVQRAAESVAFRLAGSLPWPAHETMHGVVSIEGGRFTGFSGAGFPDPLERQGDGTFDTTSNNDEVFWTPAARAVPFYMTTTVGDDHFRLFFTPDPLCHRPTPTFQCNDGRDNDGDGRVDFPADPDCTSPYDDSEASPGVRACADQTFEDVVNAGQAPRFTDLAEQSEAGRAAAEMACRDVMNGFSDRTFRPDRHTNRAEASKFFLRAAGAAVPRYTATGLPFSDVQPGQWYVDFVVRANQLGVVRGDPQGTFRPAAPVTRAEFLMMAVRAFEFRGGPPHGYLDVPSWADQGASLARSAGLWPGQSLNPSRPMTREEVAVTLTKILAHLGR